MTEIIKLSATCLVELIRTKQLSSFEITQAFLNRIKEVNPRINAVIQLDEENALLQAKNADKQLAQGKNLGPLHGLPITVKDTIDILGFKNSYGSHLYDNYIPKQDGTCIRRLKNAGAIIMGLTNVPELLGAFESDNLLYGQSKNPYDLNRTPGGSSGGEAAILAVNGSALGLGTDGGGSIRVPAHFCGISGIKPTQGLVPKTGIALPGAGAGCLQAFGTCGPMARYVDDLTLALSVIAGPDKFDPDIPPVQLGNPNTIQAQKLKVAYFTDNGVVKPTQDIIDATLNAVNVFKELGAQVTEAKPQGIEKTFELHWEPFFTLCDNGINVDSQLEHIPENKISPLRKQFVNHCKEYNITAAELNKRFSDVAKFRWTVYDFLNQFDIIICPPCATVAKLHGTTLDQAKDFTYTMTFNNTGSPAVVVPFGKSASGLPIGVQIVANLWQDHVALAAAKILEDHYLTNCIN